MIQHFRLRRAMTGQGISSLMGRWGVISFFAKQLFADLWIMICFCVFFIWTDGELGASLSASDFLKRSIQEFINSCILHV